MGWRIDRLPPRSRSERVIAGVCSGIGAVMGISVAIVRVAFVVLTVVWIGPPLYLLAWLLMPPSSQATAASAANAPMPQRYGRPPAPRQAVGLGLMTVGAVVLARDLRFVVADELIWPVLLLGLGVGVVVWRSESGAGSGRSTLLRITAGTMMLAVGIGFLAATRLSLAAVRDGLLSAGLAIGGLALIGGPWVTVLLRERREERLQRVRADERAEMAAHLHDSVLQTLAMVQRSDDPAAMSALARRQERELRRWLYGEQARSTHGTVRDAVEHMAASVEDRHGVMIEVVAVGDAPVDAAAEALVAAAGEAMTNAARWSGCERIDVYVEAGEGGVEAYVRDRGRGFDQEAVAEDCRGIKDSIHGRLARVGGTSQISTGHDVGTEVRLSVTRP